MNAQEIRKLVEQDKLIIGHNAVLRAVKSGSATRVLAAENAEPSRLASLREYCGLSEIDFADLELRNTALGTACRKPFPISFLAVTE